MYDPLPESTQMPIKKIINIFLTQTVNIYIYIITLNFQS